MSKIFLLCDFSQKQTGPPLVCPKNERFPKLLHCLVSTLWALSLRDSGRPPGRFESLINELLSTPVLVPGEAYARRISLRDVKVCLKGGTKLALLSLE